MKEYTIENTVYQNLLFVTDIHLCDSVWHHTKSDQRMPLMCEALQKEYAHKPFDAIFCLGDYSLDFWAWDTKGSYLHTPPVSNTEKFVNSVLPSFPVRPFMIPGNHEQYGQEKWQEITGFPRQYSVVYGNYVFLMCDTFGGNLDPKEHSDGTYTGIDPEFLQNNLEKYPDKTFFLCMHDLIETEENEKARKLICAHPQILCAFSGHIHTSNTVLLSEKWRHLPVFYCGDFSYSLNDRPDFRPNWGYRTLDLSRGFSTEYIPCLQNTTLVSPWGKD